MEDMDVPPFPSHNSLPPERGQQQPHDDFLYTDTIGIYVEAEWGSLTETGLQLCPAIFIPSAAQIPRAVKHIYSRLAAAASELDQGVPDVLLSLVGTGNSFSFENSERLVHGLGHLISRCSLWAISSGEQSDPLAVALSASLRSTLGQADCSPEETLVIVVNCSDVRHAGTNNNPAASMAINEGPLAPPTMADARLNTFYLVWDRSSPGEQEMLIFRACAAIKLANPPPALLIGVPEERSSATGLGPFTQAQTPIGAAPNSPAAILLPSAPSAERQPLPLVLFCGATLNSLIELLVYVQCGVPALLVQDISELCVVLKGAFSLFQNAGFEHATFDYWLDRELRMVAMATEGHYSQKEIDQAKCRVFQLVLTVSTSDHSLLSFIPANQLDQLGQQAMDLLVRNAPDANQLGRTLSLAVKMGANPRTLNSIRLEGVLGQEQICGLLQAALAASDGGGGGLEVLAALLDQNVPIQVNGDFLMGWAEQTNDQYFFNTIVLGHLLRESQSVALDQPMAKEINRLMCFLSGGVSNGLFPFLSVDHHHHLLPSSTPAAVDSDRSIRLLATWSLLLHRPHLIRLFCAYSADPLALSLALAKSARTLARLSRPWFFYEHSLLRLSQQLSLFAVHLLDAAYAQEPARAYNALCRHLPTFRQLTLPQLAYETNARDFLAHECCQRWVLRLLYGHIKVRTIWRSPFSLPNWIKILLSALFIFPIAFWIRPREGQDNSRPQQQQQRPLSPTVALLEDGRQLKKVRTSSANSMHSIRSGGGGGPTREGMRRMSAVWNGDTVVVNLANGATAGLEADAIQQQSTNDDSTLTDSFLPSASQMRGSDEMESRRRREQQREAADAVLLLHQQRPIGGGSRRQSPDRRSLMFYDGGSAGGDGSLKRRRSRTSSSRLLALNPSAGAGPGGVAHSDGFSRRRRHSSSAPTRFFCPSTVALFYSTPIAKYWFSLAFRLLYLLSFGYALAQPGCFLSGWREQLLWLWALCWLLDSLWVFVCRAQLGDWRQHRWALFDLTTCAGFLLALLAMRIFASSALLGWPSAYELRACWALFLLYECHKTLFVYVPLSDVLGPMLVRIRLMLTRDLVNFLLLVLLLLASSAVAIKATLFPDLSAKPVIMAETFGWTFQQLYTTDLGVLRQSSECQRQLLPESRPFCQALGGYANPRCPAQHWLAQFTVFQYLFFLKLLCWPILFALFARTAKRVEEEADQIWKFQLYQLATEFSLRPCLPPPLTPLSLLLLACGHFGAGGLSCFFHRPTFGHCLATDHPDMGGAPAPHSARPKFATVYKNPSVLSAHVRPLSGFWRRLGIVLWKKGGQERKMEEERPSGQDKASLLVGFAALKQKMEKEEEEEGETERRKEDGIEAKRLEPAAHRHWLHLRPDYRPNSFSKPARQFPMDIQKHVDDPQSPQSLLELAKKWRQRRLEHFFGQADGGGGGGDGGHQSILLTGNGLPLNPAGRQGLAGRGQFARFGPNRMLLYALFRQGKDAPGGDIQVLVQRPSGLLPSRWHAGGRPMVDEFLAQLLLQLGLPDPEIHALSMKTGLLEAQRDGPVCLVCTERVKGEANWPPETDNAWAEARLWAIDLTTFAHFHQLAEGGELAWKALAQLGGEQRTMVQRGVAMFRGGGGEGGEDGK